MIIGITGGTGCGKTTALEAIQILGGMILDCDAIYHRLLQTDEVMLARIAERFPGTVTDGQLRRKKLGSIVFADPEALGDLNSITHSAVKQEVLRLLESKPSLAAIDAIGLFEGGLAPICDYTVAITAPEELRIARLMARDGISHEYAAARIAAQRSQAEFSALCDFTLENDTTREAFSAKCLAFFRELAIIKKDQSEKETPL
ncbi:MAG: dephospho-CoA kinase [Oscillospiraceae bacterium]|nr:dephospho-CoA kinase [Oscillospiraceae bacterium]